MYTRESCIAKHAPETVVVGGIFVNLAKRGDDKLQLCELLKPYQKACCWITPLPQVPIIVSVTSASFTTCVLREWCLHFIPISLQKTA